MKKAVIVLVVVSLTMVGCASMNNQQKGAAIGAAGGAAVGAALGGGVWGVLAGAAVGGVAGNAIGKKMDQQAKELEQAVPTAEVKRVSEGINMTFDSSMMFEINSADLKPGYKDDLAAAAGVFNKYADTNLLIEGHTDNTGTDAINNPLSEKRAKAVSSFLKTQGVAASRLQEKWYGSSMPKYPNDTPENQAKNRRVEIGIWANEDMIADAQDGTLD
ncbi:MAG: OmpA family protein [Acidobacteria bacterium]|nr:OmpA family protein [Acidobacteriota bacterium]